MPSKGEGILLSDLAICVGIVDRKAEQKLAQLVILEQPQNLLTKPWQNEETFKTGKWYRRMKNGLWVQMDYDLVPTKLSKMDGLNTQIKLCSQFEFVDALSAQRPICLLFGAGNNHILPIPRCGFRDKEGNSPLPAILYCVYVQLAFSIGSLPNWSYGSNSHGLLDKFQWSPAFEEEDSLYLHLFNSYRSEGIIVDKISLQKTPQNGSIQNCYLILDKNGKISIYLNKKDRTADLGKKRTFSLIRINCFKFPLNLVLNFAPIKRNNGQSTIEQSSPMKIKKLNNLDYSIELNITKEILAEFGPNKHNIRLPFLGILSDPLSHIEKEKLKIGQQICLEAKVQWHFKGEMALWTVIECKIGEKIDVNIGRNGNKTKMENENENSDSEEMNFPIRRQSFLNPTIASWVNDVGEFKILVVHFAMKPTNAIFLEFCEKQKSFTARYDISLRLDQKTTIGEWYWLKYSQPPMVGSRRSPLIARELAKTNARCQTRPVLGICAQFTGCRQTLINIWHNSAKFCGSIEAINCDEWSPNLCAKCFPELLYDARFKPANSLGGSSLITFSNLAEIHRLKPIRKKINGGELTPDTSRLNSRQQNESRANSEQKNSSSNPKMIQRKLTINRPPPIQINANIFRRTSISSNNNDPKLHGYGKPPQSINEPIRKLPQKMSPQIISNDGAMISEEESSSDESTLESSSTSLNISSSNDENHNPNLLDEYQIVDVEKFELVPKELSGKTTNSQNQVVGFGGDSCHRNSQFSADNSTQSSMKVIDNGNTAQCLQNLIAPKMNMIISTESMIAGFSSMKMSEGCYGEGNSAVLNGLQQNVPPTNPFKMTSSKYTQSNDNNNISEALEANLDDDFE